MCARSSAFDFFQSMEDPAVTRSHSHEAVQARRGHAVMATHSAHLCFLPRSRGHRGQPTGAAVKRVKTRSSHFEAFATWPFLPELASCIAEFGPSALPAPARAPGTRARPVLPNTCEHSATLWTMCISFAARVAATASTSSVSPTGALVTGAGGRTSSSFQYSNQSSHA